MKPIYKSWTLWFNIGAAFILGGLEALTDVVPTEWLPHIVTALAVGNVLLRFKTKTGVSLRGAPNVDAE